MTTFLYFCGYLTTEKQEDISITKPAVHIQLFRVTEPEDPVDIVIISCQVCQNHLSIYSHLKEPLNC